ncbi:hypothetical protein [Candidatus Magnetomonas plexicatena]|uniref:hypothetical protein n=1 Tax=Candidatus Magnetomonas plexicatena TaxID=2552947 RepID=UPI001103559B|nr:hypothetical protein E2O03_001045 [Nitrospirales bacterium LBB_01]
MKIIVAVSLLIIVLLPLKLSASENILKNGGFEEIKDVKPAYWSSLFWHYRPNAVYLGLSDAAPFEKNYYLTIKNVVAGESQLIQALTVSPSTYYRISCMVKASTVGKAGAYVGLRERHLAAQGVLAATFGDMYGHYRSMGGYSDSLFDTHGKWTPLSETVKTSDSQTTLTAVVGLGAYENFSTGEAAFDNCSVTKERLNEERMYHFENNKNHSDFLSVSGPEAKFLLYNTTIAVVFFLICVFGIKNRLILDTVGRDLAVVLATALTVRILAAFYIEGYPYDIELFKEWAVYIGQKGIGHYYSGEIVADYPPGYVYILYVVQLLGRIFSIVPDSRLFFVILTSPAIAADVLCGVIIYKTAKQKGLTQSMSVVLSALYLFNPAIIVNSSVWGQVDSVFTLALAMAAWFLVNGKIEKSILTFAVTILIKPQGLLFIPVYLWAFILSTEKRRYVYSMFFSVILFYAAFIPFYCKIDIITPIKFFASKFTQYPYATNSAFNLYALLDGMSVPVENTFFVINYITAGALLVLSATAISLYVYSKRRNINYVYFTAFFLFSFFYVFATQMSSRYIYSALIFSIFTFITTRNFKVIFLYALFSTTMFLNDSHIQYRSVHNIYHVEFFTLFMKLVSVVNIIAVMYLTAVYLKNFNHENHEKCLLS